MTVSVVVPVYNTEKYLPQCLDSILAQTFADFELICVNDGSSDESPAILERYAARDARVRVIHQENQGGAAARNRGLDEATGRYICFLDSDDFYAPELLASHVAQMEKTGADVCCCLGEYYRQDTGTYAPWRCLHLPLTPRAEVFTPSELGRNLFRFTFSGPTNKLFRLDYLRQTGLRYQSLRNLDDLYFICMGIARARAITVTTEKTLAYYRVGMKTNLQANSFRYPLDNVKAGTALKEGLKAAGLYPKFRAGYDNFIGFELEAYTRRMLDTPEAFAQMHRWYWEQGGRDIYDLALDSLDAGTLSNLLMTFDGIGEGMDAETARLRIAANREKYAPFYQGHALKRLRFVYGRLTALEGRARATRRVAGYLLDRLYAKRHNRG